MAILNKLSERTILIVSGVLLVISLLVIGVYKLNTGVDYMDATVFVVQIDHEEKLATVISNATLIQSPSRVEKESTGKFYLYYQDLNTDQIARIKDGFAKVQPGVVSFDQFYYKPAREVFLKNRLLLITGSVGLIGLVYLLTLFRDLKLKRAQVLALISSELVLLAFALVLNLGFASVLGKLGVVMDNSFFAFTLGGLSVIILFSLYTLIRIKDLLTAEKFAKLPDLYSRLKNKYWPEAVFLFSTGLLVMAIPWVVVARPVAFGSLQMAWALMIGLYVFFYLRPALSKALFNLIAGQKYFDKSAFWQRQW